MTKMNLAESLWVNSPIRVRQLRRSIGPAVLGLADRSGVRRVLEVGCGQGVGIELVRRNFVGAEVVGIDVDARMIRRAQRRLDSHQHGLDVQVGDACAMRFDDGSFDVIVDFAVIHHIAAWTAALGEIARVLAPGGQFLFEDYDVARHNWLARTLYAHPKESFTAVEFAHALTGVGIDVRDRLADHDGHFVGRGIKHAASPAHR